jgi:CheY-like chemotaxis protein/HPt (histidine-containing phosphotransfer) domain-containing protein
MMTTTEYADVVVAEDEEGMALLVQLQLEKAGYSVASVDDGALALQQVAICKPQLLLLDLGLPIIDGMTVLRTLRSQPDTQHLPIVVLSGHDDVSDLRSAQKVGATDFLVKPITVETLIDSVSRHVTRATTDAFDLTHLTAWLDGDNEAVRKHVQHFIDATEERLHTIDLDLRQNDLVAAQNCLHALRGSLVNITADTTIKSVRRAERNCDDGNTGANQELFMDVRHLIERLELWLENGTSR